MDKKGIGKKLTRKAFLCICILAAASAAVTACGAPTTAPPTARPATAAPPTATPAPAPTPTLAPSATPTDVFNGQARVDVSASQDVALDALTNVHPDRADPVVLAGQINALAQFSVDTTFTVEPDRFNRAMLAYAGDGDVIMKLAGQDEEITGGSVRFFPQKNGDMIAARLQHNGGETGLDILDAANDHVMAYRKVEENGAVSYEIVAEVDEAGQWVEYTGEQVKRYKESETIFAEAGVEAEAEFERVFLNPMEALAGELVKYDFEKPVFRAVSSDGVELIIPHNTEVYPVRYTIGLDGDPNNTELADLFLNKLWPELQVAYNNAGRTPQEIASNPVEPFMMAVDADLAHFYTGKGERINPLSGNPPLLQKIPMTMGDVSRVIFLAGKTSVTGSEVPEGDHQVTLTVPTDEGDKDVTVINMYAPITSGGNATYTILAFTDQRQPDKRVLVFLEEAQEPQTDQIMAYNLMKRLLEAPYRAMMSEEDTQDIVSRSLSGNGHSPEFTALFPAYLNDLYQTVAFDNEKTIVEEYYRKDRLITSTN